MLPSLATLLLAVFTGLAGAVFLLSGLSKVGRSAATLSSMVQLRVPTRLQRRDMAQLVPVWELLLAVALLVAPGWWRTASAGLALLTLGIFTVFLVAALRRDDDVDCGCFGPLSASNRVTGFSVARNLVFMAVLVCVGALGAGSPSLPVLLVDESTVFVLTVALTWALMLCAVLVVTVVRLRRPDSGVVAASTTSTGSGTDSTPGAAPDSTEGSAEQLPAPEPAPLSPGSLALGLDPARPGEPGIGAPIPRGELVAASGATQPLHELGHGKPVLLFFLSAECGSCHSVLAQIPQWQRQLDPLQVRVATSSWPRALEAIAPDVVPLARYGAAAARQAFGVQRSPAAVALGGQQEKIVASPIAYGELEIEGLVQALLQTRQLGN